MPVVVVVVAVVAGVVVHEWHNESNTLLLTGPHKTSRAMTAKNP